MTIHNAIIHSTRITTEDRCLNVRVELRHDQGSQCLPGFTFYLPIGELRHDINGPVGHYLWRVLEVAGTTEWDRLRGRAIRVQISDGLIVAIGHIVNDDWFWMGKDVGEAEKALEPALEIEMDKRRKKRGF